MLHCSDLGCSVGNWRFKDLLISFVEGLYGFAVILFEVSLGS